MWYAERRELLQEAANVRPMARAQSLTEFKGAFPDKARCTTSLFERRWLQVNPSRQRRCYRLMNPGQRDKPRRKARVFDGGEFKLVILALVAERPRHGYEIIKELRRRGGFEYSPSPGVVYPTLTLLKETGYATVSEDDAGRKLYTVTQEGNKVLANNKAEVNAIFARLRYDLGEPVGRSVLRAMQNLEVAVRLRLFDDPLTQERIQAIIDALDATAKTIERT
jgi:DNA-binding PadR family transcriptional regulator